MPLSPAGTRPRRYRDRSEEHTSELQSHVNLVCRLLLEKKTGEPARHGGGVAPGSGGGAGSPRARAIQHEERANTDSTGKERRSREETVDFFFNDTATTEIYTLSLHDALPI